MDFLIGGFQQNWWVYLIGVVLAVVVIGKVTTWLADHIFL